MKKIAGLLRNPEKTVRRRTRAFFVGIVIACCLLIFAVPASALLPVVNDLGDLGDANPGDTVCATSEGKCTLRAAIEEINAYDASSNTITFSDGLSLPGTILLGSSLPNITSSMSIIGPGSDLLTIDMQTAAVFFVIQVALPKYVYMKDLRITGGSSPSGGGAVLIQSNAWADLEGMVFEANHAPRGGAIACDGCTLWLRKDRFTGNQALDGAGGAIDATAGSTLDIQDSVFESNAADLHSGGAIYAIGSDVTILRSRIESNSAGYGGGGLSVLLASGNRFVCKDTIVSGNSGGSISGGGIYLGGTGLSAILQNVTVTGNQTDIYGGGLYVTGSTPYTVIANSTFSENRAAKSGGGIHHAGGGTIALSNVTITGNEAGWNPDPVVGGGIRASGAVVIENTVIAGNSDLSPLAYYPDCVGNLISSAGYNIIGENCSITPAAGDNFGDDTNPVDPLLVGLARNGGTTLTNALLSGSPAIGAGNAGGCTWDDDADGGATPEVALTEDQRTADRPYPVGGRCDVGAFEWSHCDNGISDNDEEGVDCGGSLCAACSCPSTGFAAVGNTTFAYIQDAYDLTWDGAEIRAREEDTGEALIFDRPAHISLIGGHDCDFFRIRGMTTVASLTVSAGRLTIENVEIGP